LADLEVIGDCKGWEALVGKRLSCRVDDFPTVHAIKVPSIPKLNLCVAYVPHIYTIICHLDIRCIYLMICRHAQIHTYQKNNLYHLQWWLGCLGGLPKVLEVRRRIDVPSACMASSHLQGPVDILLGVSLGNAGYISIQVDIIISILLRLDEI